MNLGKRGDTIVEVLLATVIISIVLAGAYSLSNRATRINQSAIERTTVANYMREQIELIRGLRSTGYQLKGWQNIINNKVIIGTPAPMNKRSCPPATPREAFFVVVKPEIRSYDSPDFIKTYVSGTDARPDLYQIWIEAYSPAATSDYIDFYVRACWEGIGSAPVEVEQAILRLAK